ncbi:MAG: HlyC/CorC family transporter [Labilithrix sp.]|nr:HlyC/CorC family transporter [Labilithrix sp.]
MQRIVLALFGSVLCLALNAFFVAAEFALVKVRITQLDRAIRRGDRRASAAKDVLQRLDRYLSVTQFGITVASLGLGWIGEPAVTALADHVAMAVRGEPLGRAGHIAVGVFGLGLLTFLHLLVGELVPKFVAIQHPVATSLVSALPLQIVNTVFRPVLWVLEKAQRVVLRALGIDPDHVNEGTLSEDELIGILAAAATRDPKTEDKRRIIERILRFGTRPVRQMMVPRVDVIALSIDATGEEAYSLLQRHQFSRVLLVRESFDEVAGYLYAKDFLLDPRARERTTLHGLERRVFFFPEAQGGLSALRDMQREQTPFAVVVDEYGGTSGIVTLEDLVEEIVGEIRDELDVEPARVAPIAGEANAWNVDGGATVDDLRDAGVPVAEQWAGEPIGRVVLEQLGHLPHVGDVVRLAEGVFAKVMATHRRRVQRLEVRFTPERNAAPSAS